MTPPHSLRAQLTDPRRRPVEPSHGDPRVTVETANRSRRRVGVIPPGHPVLDVRSRQRAISRGLSLLIAAHASDDADAAQALADASDAHLARSGAYELPDGSLGTQRVIRAIACAATYGRQLGYARRAPVGVGVLRRYRERYARAHDAALEAMGVLAS